jgi:hypothetical protein
MSRRKYLLRLHLEVSFFAIIFAQKVALQQQISLSHVTPEIPAAASPGGVVFRNHFCTKSSSPATDFVEPCHAGNPIFSKSCQNDLSNIF